jgi:F0F1-type ATP synthase membrane subunit b/b'
MDVNALENNLREQVEAGIMTDFELRRIMARATGGTYLDDEQKEQYESAQEFINNTLEVLNKLHVISAKRVDSTRRKLQKAVVKHIVNGGTLNEDGTPDVSALEFWE